MRSARDVLPILGRPAGPVLVAVVALGLAASHVFRPAELLLRDALLRAAPRRLSGFVAVVLVDEEAVRKIGPWPWPRGRLADVVDSVRVEGAAGVVLDVLLPESREGDGELATALARIPSVVAAAPDEDGGWLLPADAIREAATLAHATFDLDEDGIVRRFLSTKDRGDISLPGLPVAAARLVRPELPVPVGGVVRPGFRAAGGVPTFGAAAVLGDRLEPNVLRGRVTFVGVSAVGVGDRVVSPLSSRGVSQSGVLVHAAATEAILTGDELHPVAPYVAAILAGILALAAAAALSRFPRVGPHAWLAAPLAAVPIAAIALLVFRLELPVISMTGAGLAVEGAFQLDTFMKLRRTSTETARRVRGLEALAAQLEAEKRQDAESRRVVAHELRTPLTSVRGLAQLLAEFDISPADRRRVAGMVVKEAARLSGMVEALLDLERLKLRDFRAVATSVDFSRVVAERVELLRRGVGGNIRLASDASCIVRGDAVLLGRIVDNLAGNALKFGPAEQFVDLSIHTRPDGTVVLEVADCGPGIPPEERDRVFDRFFRCASTAAIPGLGLGLALVADVVRWHGGRAAVDERPGGGSVFRVSLPAFGARAEDRVGG